MRRLLAVLVLSAFVLGACDSGGVRVPDDWRQYTGFCTIFGKPTEQRYTFWYPPEWVENEDYGTGFYEFADFDSSAREGDAHASVSCNDSTVTGYWGQEGSTIEGALQQNIASTEQLRGDDNLKILDSGQYSGPYGKILSLAYTDTWLGWSSTIELTTYSSPVVWLSYQGEHEMSDRERDLLLEVIRTVEFSE